jgi:tetratricopeptide (TPR) repeat protein
LRAFVEAADGHPLLLQLTASWLRREQAANYEPATIYRLKRDDVTLLREIQERHRDVETSVGELLDRAFDRLYPLHLQVLLLRLSVLRQRFGLMAAQAIIDEPTDLSDLRKLVRSSFLQEQRQGEDWWFDFLPLIQRYLRQRAAQELAIAHEKAIDFFWNQRKPWTGALEDCREELEAFHHLCELGHYAQAYQAMITCVDLLDRAGYYSSLMPVYERLTQAWQTKDDSEIQALGWAWTRLGNIYISLGRFQDAIATHQQAQQKFQSIAYRQGEAASLGNLGSTYRSLGQYQQAINLLQQSLEIQHEIGNRHGEADALNNLGSTYGSLGQYQQAINLLQQSLEIQHEIGNRHGEAASLGNLGSTYRSLGQYQQAINLLQQSLEIKREIGNRYGEAYSLGNLGNAYHSLGQYQQAINLYQQSLEIKREIGDRHGEADALGNLGIAYYSLGQYQQAINLHQQSLEIKREIGDRQGEADALGNLGNAYHSLGQYQQAINLHQQSLEIKREIDDRHGEADALGNLGIAYYSLGQYQQAINLLQQSLEIQHEIGNRHGEAATLGNLGIAYRLLGQYQEALKKLNQAKQLFAAMGLDYRVEWCDTAINKINQSIATKSRPQKRVPLWVYFLIGLAIVLLIAWLL